MVPICTSRLYLVTCALMGALECLMKKVLFLLFALALISCKRSPAPADTAESDSTDTKAEVLPDDVTAADVAEAATPVAATPTAQ